MHITRFEIFNLNPCEYLKYLVKIISVQLFISVLSLSQELFLGLKMQ